MLPQEWMVVVVGVGSVSGVFSVRCMPKCLWELEQQIDVLIYSPDSQGHKRALRRADSRSHRASVAKTSSFDRPAQGYKGHRATAEPVRLSVVASKELSRNTSTI
jgi:hypothetical protein